MLEDEWNMEYIYIYREQSIKKVGMQYKHIRIDKDILYGQT